MLKKLLKVFLNTTKERFNKWALLNRVCSCSGQFSEGSDALEHKAPALFPPLPKEMLPDVWSKPSVAQLWVLPTGPATGYQGEELSTSLCTPSPLKTVQSNVVTLQPPFLQTWQAQNPQSLLLRLTFHPCHQLCWPPLDTSKDLHIFLKLKPRTALSSQGDTAPMLSTAGWSPFLTGCCCCVWCTPGWVCPPACPGSHCWLILSLLLTRTHRSVTAKLLSSRPSPRFYLWPVLLHSKCRILHFDLLNLMPLIISLCSNLASASLLSLRRVSYTSQFGIIADGALDNCWKVFLSFCRLIRLLFKNTGKSF